MNEEYREVWQFADAVNSVATGLMSHGAGRRGITFKEIVYLSAIHCGHDTVTRLSERLGVSKAAATKMADRMCAERLLVRVQDPSDGRVVHLVMPESIARRYAAGNAGFGDLAHRMEEEYGSEAAAEFWEMLRYATYQLNEFSGRITE